MISAWVVVAAIMRASSMARRPMALCALLAATASALSCSQRRESPALPLDDGANYSLGSPASDWAPGTLPGRYGEALDFSGAVLDAPVPAFAHRTALHRKNATARRRLAGGAIHVIRWHCPERKHSSWLKVPSALPEDSAPSASRDHRKAQPAPTHSGAPPEHRGSLP